MITFDELGLCDEVLDAVDAMNFTRCTPIQEQAIPMILDGDDLLGVAQTGTGKTAAYLLPIIDNILTRGCPENRINCLVMVPTRELAMQVDQQLQGFSYYVPISSIAIYGGTDGKVYTQQHNGLKNGVDIVIATPGRLLAHMAMGSVDLSQTQFLVLDEADRMLDMGFCDDIMNIVGRMSKQRQTLMFSATMPRAIENLAKSILDNPRKIKLSIAKPPEKINQMACLCQEGEKEHILQCVLKNPDLGKTIVFAASKLKVKDMGKSLRKKGMKVAEMHSDLDQLTREETMRGFKAGRTHILVATDLVARGIDIDDIEMVINFDVPHDCDDYVHRVGRTARAQRDGQSLTLVTPRDRQYFKRIQEFLGQPGMHVKDKSFFTGEETAGTDTEKAPRRRKPSSESQQSDIKTPQKRKKRRYYGKKKSGTPNANHE